MTRYEFLVERTDLIVLDIWEFWGVQTEHNGDHFVFCPLPELEYFFDMLDTDIETGICMYDEDEFEDEDSPYPEDCYQDCKKRISDAYDSIIEARKPYDVKW